MNFVCELYRFRSGDHGGDATVLPFASPCVACRSSLTSFSSSFLAVLAASCGSLVAFALIVRRVLKLDFVLCLILLALAFAALL